MGQSTETKEMIADFMENGFLNDIIDMFKNNRKLFAFLGDLIADERGRVRIGTVALVEDLRETYPEELAGAIHGIAKSLKAANPIVRADTAYLLGVINNEDALPYLSKALNDENALVREAVEETIAFISDLSEEIGTN
ncbi:MAG: HEAT repeat domain-containing protein [Nitrospirae bacterium]|nr:HEAT repeat domain-containing protein [Nitrospirota bacterium]MBI4838361.1 HEAT repeat domain-containing protein [Nitrospirota bacterium]